MASLLSKIIMTNLNKIIEIQNSLRTNPDGKIRVSPPGETLRAVIALAEADPNAPWPPQAQSGRILRGDGSFPWTAEIDGDDIVIRNARVTCFGGSEDPQDSGETASGISTKANPGLMACALPMNYTGVDGPTRRALIGSPIPMLPWKTLVRFTDLIRGSSIDVPVIDLGPARDTGNQADLSIAAARHFDAGASARDFELRCEVRILGGAKFAV